MCSSDLDLRAPTPTAAAELVSQGMFELADKLESMKILLVKEIKNLIQDKKHSILELNSRIKNPKDLLKSWSQMIDLHEIKIVNHIKKTLLIINNRLKNNEQALVSLSPNNIVAALKNNIRENASLLRRLMKTNLKDFSNETFVLKEKIEALNPLAILQRGFSVTFDANGKIIKNAKEVRTHDLIRTKLASGEIISKINETD